MLQERFFAESLFFVRKRRGPCVGPLIGMALQYCNVVLGKVPRQKIDVLRQKMYFLRQKISVLLFVYGFVYGLPTIRARFIHGLSTVCLRFIHGLSTVCLRFVYDLSTLLGLGLRQGMAVE